MDASRSATVRFSIPFCDVDAMQVVWHGNYFKYFDAARDRLFGDAGIDLYQVMEDGGLVFPITRTQTKHIRPLRFRDDVEPGKSIWKNEVLNCKRFGDAAGCENFRNGRADAKRLERLGQDVLLLMFVQVSRLN